MPTPDHTPSQAREAGRRANAAGYQRYQVPRYKDWRREAAWEEGWDEAQEEWQEA